MTGVFHWVDRHDRIVRSKEIVPEKRKPLKMDEYIGRRVVLLHNTQTNGGTQFRAGEILVVDGHWRGRLDCHGVDDPKRYIRKLNRFWVEVLDGDVVRP